VVDGGIPRRFEDAKLSDFAPDGNVSTFLRSMGEVEPVKRRAHLPGAGFTGEEVEVYDMQGMDGLVIVGPVGAGKTHMAAAVYNTIPVPRYFISALAVVEAEKAAITDPDKSLSLHDRNCVLILDDLSAVRPTEFALDVLSRIVRCRYDAMLPTVTTTHTSHDGLSDIFGAAIASRILEMGPIVKLEGADRRRG